MTYEERNYQKSILAFKQDFLILTYLILVKKINKYFRFNSLFIHLECY